MALSQSVSSELLEAFRAGEGVDLIRESVRLVMQDLIEVEAAEVVGAGRYERSGDRTTVRNGSTAAGLDPGRRCRVEDPEASSGIQSLSGTGCGEAPTRCRCSGAPR